MEVKNIQNGLNTQYDSFLLDALNIGKSTESNKSEAIAKKNKQSLDKTTWQHNVLLSALSDLENNIQVDNSSPLFSENNVPIETYKEALEELRKVVEFNNKEMMEHAQANLTPKDILHLFEDQFEFLV